MSLYSFHLFKHLIARLAIFEYFSISPIISSEINNPMTWPSLIIPKDSMPYVAKHDKDTYQLTDNDKDVSKMIKFAQYYKKDFC